RIRDKNGTLVELRANRAQSEYELHCTQRNIVLKARQLGVSTYVAARFFINVITRPGTLAVQVAHDQRSAEEIFRIVHRFQENLPEGVRQGALMTSRANVRQIVFPRMDSEYRVETAAGSNAGRGLTIHNLHCSEVAHWPHDAANTLASLRAAVPPHGEIVLESTPDGAGGCFYQEWQQANASGYTRHFFPWWFENTYVTEPNGALEVTKEEEELVKRHYLNNAQLAYRRLLRAGFRGLAPQEFAEDPVSCFLASGDCVFDVSIIELRLPQCGEPLEWRDNRRVMIWWPPQPGHQYIMGVDPAGGGTEGDYACAQVIDRSSGMQCAELHGHFPPRELSSRVAALGHEYNCALVAVERNNHGYGVLAHLGSTDAYSRIYERNGQAGWPTTAATRPAMIENFAAILADAPQLFHSPRLLQECRTFVRRADGNSGANSGAHDDCVMAMAIALEVRKEQIGRGREFTLEVGSL